MSEASGPQKEQPSSIEHTDDSKDEGPQPSGQHSESAEGDSTKDSAGVETAYALESIFESDSSDDEPVVVEATTEFVTREEFEQLKADLASVERAQQHILRNLDNIRLRLVAADLGCFRR